MDTATEHDTQMILRISRETKAKIERAAAVLGQSVSGFASTALDRAADDILGRHQIIVLGDAERDFFLTLLDTDQEPSEKTKEGVRSYNALSSQDATGEAVP